MPHIFRFHAGRNNNIYDWKTSDKIMPADVREVMDKTNILTSAAGTSIPTPIARMYLFKTAFEIIAAQVRDNKVDTKGIYAGLVSETLDLLELLYKCGNDENKFRYHKWVFDNSQQDDKVINSFFGDQHGHQLLAESFKQAVAEAPFNNRLEITFIYYREGNKELLVGGTSPFTFVFTTPNFTRKLWDRGYKPIAGLVSEDILFDTDYKQLHERDESFIKYVESLVNSERIPPSFQGITEYVINTNTRYHNKFNSTLPSLQNLQIGDTSLTTAKINLKQLHEEGYKQQINNYSDFKMSLPEDSSYTGSLNPLFLLDRMEYEGLYTSPTNKWISTTKVSELEYPATTLSEIMQRELPGVDGISYPFLSSFDFFERCLVKLPDYLLNDEKFLTITNNQGFALPLKPLFFHFFPIGKMKEYLSVEVKGDQVSFTLKIPIFGPTKAYENRSIVYKKTYTADTTVQYSGIIGIYPFTHSTQEELLHTNKYTVASFEKTNVAVTVNSIVFFKKTGIHPVVAPLVPRSQSDKSNVKSGYYQVNESFDIVQLNFKKDNAALACLILPKFKELENGTEEYIYAIDFGTSNTHVEYGRVSMDKVTETKPFAIEEKNMQVAFLNKPRKLQPNDAVSYNDYEFMGNTILEGRQLTFREFMPFQIGPQPSAFVKFPFRTATCESNSFVMNQENNKLFINANIGFFIDSDALTDDIRYSTDLKWKLENAGSDKLNQNRVSLFFQELLLMIRTKALMEQENLRGDIKKLKIALSFPISMGSTLRTNLVDLFEAQKNEVLGTAQPLREASESIAPYYQLRFANVNIQNDSFCNIDIGGGTTDIVLIDKNLENPNILKCYCSSFRFAGRQLWGSGHNEFNMQENGFVSYYKNFIAKNEPAQHTKLERVLNSNSIRTEDVVGVLFSKPEYKFKEIFGENKEFRVIPLIHYTAILFYISRLATLNNVSLPRTISFSGKGSEYLNLIFPTKDDLTGYTKKVLGIFAGTPVRPDFMIEKSNEPKVITAKGAVHFANEKINISDNSWGENALPGNQKQLSITNSYYKGFNNLSLEGQNITYSQLQNGTEYFKEIMLSLSEFFNLLFDNADLCRAINNKIEIKDFSQYKSFFIQPNTDISAFGTLRDSFLAGLAKMQPGDPVAGSPFFFALDYSLVELSREISQKALK